MKRIRLVKLDAEGNETDIAIIPVDQEQAKALAEAFNGWPTAVVHQSGIYALEDWDQNEGVYVFTTHIVVNTPTTFTIPLEGKPSPA